MPGMLEYVTVVECWNADKIKMAQLIFNLNYSNYQMTIIYVLESYKVEIRNIKKIHFQIIEANDRNLYFLKMEI